MAKHSLFGIIFFLSSISVYTQTTEGLTFHLPCTSSIVDESGNNHSVTNDNVVLTNDRLDQTNNAIHFNGSSAELVVEDQNILNPEEFTIAFWLRGENKLPSEQNATILSKYSWFDGQRNLLFSFSDSTITFSVWHGEGATDREYISFPVQLQQWHHFALTYTQNDSLTLYADGCKVATTFLPQVQTSGLPIRIGNLIYGGDFPGDNNHFHGSLDDLRMYDRALPQDEIHELLCYDHLDDLPDHALHLPIEQSLVDESSNNHVIDDRVTSLVTDRFGETEEALAFDGSTSEIIIDDQNILNPQHFSIAFWLYPEQKEASEQSATIISKYSWFDGQRSFLLSYIDTILTASIWHGNVATDKVSVHTPIQTNTWQHIVITFSADQSIRLYHNACLVDEITSVGNMVTSIQPIRIGNLVYGGDFPGDNHHFHGVIDDLQIFNHTLSTCDIQSINPFGTTSTKYLNEETSSAFHIFPNPCRSTLWIESKNQDAYSIELLDLTGKRILSDQNSPQSLDISFLEEGLYVVHFRSGGKSYWRRVYKVF